MADETVSVPGGLSERAHGLERSRAVAFRSGVTEDADRILELIIENLEEGHLLPRTRDDIVAHATRFLVAVDDGRVIGCAELAPLSRAVAEVRSLVVDRAARGRGVGGHLIAALSDRARLHGFTTLCAFTHDPSHFVRLGFTIVPHVWFPEKISLDCTSCPKFRTCGQHAVALQFGDASLDRPGDSHLRQPMTTTHGLGASQGAASGPLVTRLKDSDA